MDIKQMKNFVSQELKGLKQEHRLLSLRRSQPEGRELGVLEGVAVHLADSERVWSAMGRGASACFLRGVYSFGQ